MSIDLNRNSGTLILPPAESGEIFTAVSRASAFQRAARQINIPGTGSVIHNLGKVTASIVGETELKPNNTPTVGSKLVKASEFVTIIPMSEQLVRDAAALAAAVQAQAPIAIAEKFDSVVATGVDKPANFDTLAGAQSIPVTDRASFYAAVSAVAANGSQATAIVLSTALYYTMVAAENALGQPVFAVTDTTINGVPYYLYTSNELEGYVGDFTKAVWGTVEGLKVSTTNSATLTGVGNLFELNMVAVRVEGSLAFAIADINDFVSIGAPADES
jgi:HK97 family phage major capsid protein